MSFDRRTTNPGKRERVARKRHKRGVTTVFTPAGSKTFKLGRKHSRRWAKRRLAVADS